MSVNNDKLKEYENEVRTNWGSTIQYKEYKEKTNNRNNEELKCINNNLMNLFTEIGKIKHLPVEDENVLEKIKELKDYINNNYYNCNNEMLKSLGQMYINDVRFRNNIDKAGGEGTAKFVNEAILYFANNF